VTQFSPGNPFVGDGLPGATAKKRINVGDKGKRAERQLAVWWRAHGFPDAARHVKTGDRFTPDEGDLVLVHGDFRLVVEVKHHAGGLTDGQVTEYGQKLVRKQVPQSNGSMGILVERRDRVSDPGCWWVHLDPTHFALLEIEGVRPIPVGPWVPLACRTTVGYFARLLTNAGLAGPHTTEE
jgi:hypothetical protein